MGNKSNKNNKNNKITPPKNQKFCKRLKTNDLRIIGNIGNKIEKKMLPKINLMFACNLLKTNYLRITLNFGNKSNKKIKKTPQKTFFSGSYYSATRNKPSKSEKALKSPKKPYKLSKLAIFDKQNLSV